MNLRNYSANNSKKQIFLLSIPVFFSNLSIPLVVRLAGTNEAIVKKILKDSNLKILSSNNLSDAAKKIVEATE